MSAKWNYGEKLRDPRWQKKRLEVFERDQWTCQGCGEFREELHVHHMKYKGEPWEVELEDLETLCCECHRDITDFQREIAEHVKLPQEFERAWKPKAMRWLEIMRLYDDYMEGMKERLQELEKDGLSELRNAKTYLFFRRIAVFAYGGERVNKLIEDRVESKKKEHSKTTVQELERPTS